MGMGTRPGPSVHRPWTFFSGWIKFISNIVLLFSHPFLKSESLYNVFISIKNGCENKRTIFKMHTDLYRCVWNFYPITILTEYILQAIISPRFCEGGPGFTSIFLSNNHDSELRTKLFKHKVIHSPAPKKN